MTDRLVVLKQDKPLLFKIVMIIIALPVLALLILSIVNPALRAWLVSSAKKLMEDSQKKDSKLKDEIDQAQKEIDTIDNKLDTIDGKLEAIKDDDDANWHKKEKK